MPHDRLRHRALADNLAARLRCSSMAWLKVIDRAMGADEGVRGGDAFGRRWERRIATGPADVDRSFHLVRKPALGGIPSITACHGSWSYDDVTERHDSPPLEERCTACWREAVQGDALALALIDAWGEIQAEEHAKAAAHERARGEMLPRDDIRSNHFAHCTYDEDNGFCKRDGFGIESHCTECYEAARRPRQRPTGRQTVSIGHVPGDGGDPVQIPMARHLALVDEPDREVVDEFELDHLTPGDAEEPIGVQLPDYDFEGGAG